LIGQHGAATDSNELCGFIDPLGRLICRADSLADRIPRCHIIANVFTNLPAVWCLLFELTRITRTNPS
jgi:hypothetical protein